MAVCLKDVLDKGVFRIDDDKYTDEDFKAMSIDELEKVKLRINQRIGKITTSIANKKLENNGDETELKKWYASRRSALSINERVSAYVKSLIASRLRSSKTTSDRFVSRAKAVLPREVFEGILNDAQQESVNIGNNKGESK